MDPEFSLWAASFDGTVSVWRKVAKGKWEVGAVLEGHENEVKDVAVDRAGVYLATCGRDKTVWIWELMDLGAATSMDDDGNDDDAAMESDDDLPALEFECADLKRGHGGDVKAVAWHPERPFFVSASYDDSVRVWTHDPARDEWRCAQELADTAAGGSAGHAGTVWDVAFEPTAARPDARAECRMATCSDDRAILVWSAAKDPDARPDDPPRFSLNQRLVDAHERSVLSIAWSPLGVIATAGADDALCVYADAKAGAGYERVCRVESAHGGDVNCVRFNPVRQANRVLVATAGDDAAVRLWTLTM